MKKNLAEARDTPSDSPEEGVNKEEPTTSRYASTKDLVFCKKSGGSKQFISSETESTEEEAATTSILPLTLTSSSIFLSSP